MADQTPQLTHSGNTSASQDTGLLPETGEAKGLWLKVLGGVIVVVLLIAVYVKKKR